MKSFDGVPILEAEGYCPSCREWFSLKRNNLPKHICRDTDHSCRFSENSPTEIRCVINDDAERKDVAKFLLSHHESDPCLINPHTHRHSMECKGGSICRKMMMRIRNAYIEYMERSVH